MERLFFPSLSVVIFAELCLIFYSITTFCFLLAIWSDALLIIFIHLPINRLSFFSSHFKSTPSFASTVASHLNFADLNRISHWGPLNLVKFSSSKIQFYKPPSQGHFLTFLFRWIFRFSCCQSCLKEAESFLRL